MNSFLDLQKSTHQKSCSYSSQTSIKKSTLQKSKVNSLTMSFYSNPKLITHSNHHNFLGFCL
ncbi:hypothetical protein HanXRQr2_Chr17g0828061 [Helianthus annuus]|uniref:Uncharacterized protein n=1 Tax=Helianthus annuus TaxID=4232 RepID=A0A9K3DMV2_HELAN|nr:hypothetical protein HanXRQr2_Chr17g0828061 [Helianthus annuus]KAJ0815213.1 hypothetical protein HanPSC8_Chr17g0794951 [Helianthus annuus]